MKNHEHGAAELGARQANEMYSQLIRQGMRINELEEKIEELRGLISHAQAFTVYQALQNGGTVTMPPLEELEKLAGRYVVCREGDEPIDPVTITTEAEWRAAVAERDRRSARDAAEAESYTLYVKEVPHWKTIAATDRMREIVAEPGNDEIVNDYMRVVLGVEPAALANDRLNDEEMKLFAVLFSDNVAAEMSARGWPSATNVEPQADKLTEALSLVAEQVEDPRALSDAWTRAALAEMKKQTAAKRQADGVPAMPPPAPERKVYPPGVH